VRAPDACRRASHQFADRPLFEFGIDVSDYWQMVDCGDAIGGHDDVRSACRMLLAGRAIPVLVGDDVSVSVPGVQALTDHVDGRVGYLHVGAGLHLPDAVAGLAAEVAFVGTRGVCSSFAQIDAVHQARAYVYPMQECVTRGVTAVISDALRAVTENTEALYVSLSNNAIDATYAPGGSDPAPGGFTTRELLRMADAIGQQGPTMMDISGLCPDADAAGITARLDCYWILHVLGAYADAVERGTAGTLLAADADLDAVGA
jgi:agmatinase